jgi:HlyD family secretion protein
MNYFNFRTLLIIFLSAFIISGIVACKNHQQTDANMKIVTASLQPSATHLFYSGTIAAIHNDDVVSPIDGVVEKLFFKYGEKVEKGQLLMTVNSTKLQEDYNSTLTDYIKAKDTYNRSKSSFAGTQMLYKAGIIDRNSYESEKSQMENNQLALVMATDKLEKAVHEIPDAQVNLNELSLENVDAIKSILNKQYGVIRVYANATGIALLNEKSTGDAQNADSGKSVNVGSQIKQGQILVAIGDLVGISTVIAVGELNINQIVPGQSVTITSSALPGIAFKGVVKYVAAQAKSNFSDSGGALATFPVTIVVPEITPQQRKLIRVGMDAKVEITIKNPAQIKVPITAVFQKAGISMVTLLNAKTQKTTNVPVTTGTTDLTDVIITGGVKPGDQVVVHD